MRASSDKIISPDLPATLTNFTPVPRKGDSSKGWSPQRQKAFIMALAETGSIRRAAAEVNMSRVSAYYLRRHPQGAEFKRAWDHALDFAVSYLKDIAFERAVEGELELEPVWQRGKLVGYRRKFSDRLLMFLLRQYGQDKEGRRVTVNYVKTSANVAARSAAAKGGDQSDNAAGASAESSIVTVKSRSAPELNCNGAGDAAAPLQQFSGIELDTQAEAEMARVIEDCEKRRAEFGGTTADLHEPFVRLKDDDPYWQGSFEPEGGWIHDVKDVEC